MIMGMYPGHMIYPTKNSIVFEQWIFQRGAWGKNFRVPLTLRCQKIDRHWDWIYRYFKRVLIWELYDIPIHEPDFFKELLRMVLGQLPTGDNSPLDRKYTPTIAHQDHDP